MRRRFVALVRTAVDANTGLSARFAECVREIDGLELAFENDRVSVATFQDNPIQLNGNGIILGSLFLRGRTRAIDAMGPSEAGRIAATRGGELIERYWGPYVAIVCDPEGGRVDVVRAPLGELPCYVAETDGATVIASDVDLLLRCELYIPEIAWMRSRDTLQPVTCAAREPALPASLNCREAKGS